ncbi:hypothetical protein ACLJJ6_09415 [Pediococcus siamensis]|uniref:hypothetical protein n=1 Tax=Pediococcus siamensis TaxID=381829 RepID=UPI0039A0B50C
MRYKRVLGKQVLLVICNFSTREINYYVPSEYVHTTHKCLISNTNTKSWTDKGRIVLAPYGAQVYLIDLN